VENRPDQADRDDRTRRPSGHDAFDHVEDRLLPLQTGGPPPSRSALKAPCAYGGGEYAFTPPKTSRARRSIDLPAFVVAYLRRHREEQKVRSLGGSDVVLDNGVGEPLAPWTASADFRRIVRELELPRTRFHDLRHAHATQLLAAGVHPKAVSERLGHSSVAFTMDTYSAHIPAMGRAAADAADQLFRLTAK